MCIRDSIWDINGPHLPTVDEGAVGELLYIDGETAELGNTVAVCGMMKADFDYKLERVITENRRSLRVLSFSMKAGETATFVKYITIYTSVDGVADPLKTAQEAVKTVSQQSFTELLAAHERVWAGRWEAADVQITGDDEAQLALRYNIYIMYSNVPTHTDKVAIPARGLAGQVYKLSLIHI